MMERIKDLMKSRVFWIVVGLVLIIAAFSMGNRSASMTLDEEKLTYDDLVAKIEDLETELDEKEAKLIGINEKLEQEEEKLNERKSEIEDVLELVDRMEEISDELADLEDELSSKQNEVEDLDHEIDEKEKELATLEGKIVEAVSEPITISSGQYFVGIDIPEGRYQASGSSNFVVRDSGGALKVNTILGDSSVGRGDYVFFAVDGDYIEASAQTTLTPVE